jgi:hypothetical protein
MFVHPISGAVVAGSVPAAAFERHVPAEAALCVAVANRRGLPALLEALYPLGVAAPEARPSTARLRLIGTIRSDGSVELEMPREEGRRAGPGGGVDSKIVAVTLDDEGRELQRVPVRTFRQNAPSRFALLLPVSPAVRAVELRAPDDELLPLDVAGEAVPRLLRIPSRPSITLEAGVQEGELVFTYQHPLSIQPSIDVEIVDGPLATPAIAVDACERSVQLPLQHFPAGKRFRVRLVASDGWNFDAKTLDRDFTGAGVVILRRLNGSQWWADTDRDGVFSWTLGGREIGQGRLLTLEPRALGAELGLFDDTPRALTLREVTPGDLGRSDSRTMELPNA